MCGIAGAVSKYDQFDQVRLYSMLKSIEHRGPDSSGVWTNENVYLGHRRLSIHDLSQFGHQPMTSSDQRYTVVFNGEIYNFRELRALLGTDVEWNGHSDTEVMLEAFSNWGVLGAIQKFNGMFAFAVWDSRKRKLILARDKFGEKPLYYTLQNNLFVFASELTAIERVKGINLTINRAAVSQQIQSSYIPAPMSVYNEVYKLEPGHYLEVDTINLAVEKSVYWSLASEIEAAKQKPFSSEGEAIELLDKELKKAVRLRMDSDVPLGGFLSGGVDSSLIIALMQTQSNVPVNSFSIGFDVPGYNEAVYAQEVASYLGTKHHERYLSPKDALDVIPDLGTLFDEPFSDSSQIPTLLVSKIAKEKVTVCLSGDGGDELFCGYKRYQATPVIWNKVSKLPCRNALAKAIDMTPVGILDRLFFFLKPLADKYGRPGQIGTKVKALGNWINAESAQELYRLSMQHWKDNELVVLGAQKEAFWDPACESLDNLFEEMMYKDSIAYLPGDILTKVDRASMSVSLEGRIPMLDPEVARVAWRMPIEMKQKGSDGKWALKQVLYKYLPREMMERPKMGFGVPIRFWLRNELREWASDLLSYDRLSGQGLFDPDIIQMALNRHLSGQENNSEGLWDVLMTQSWLDADVSRRGRL